MTDNNQQIDNTENTESKHKYSANRRTLVKGGLGAVPVVLTMRSGAAFAATTIESCIIRDNRHAGTSGNTPATLNNTLDGWVRRSGFCKTLTFGSERFDVYNTEDVKTKWRHVDNTPNGANNKEYRETRGPTGNVMVESGPGASNTKYAISNERECFILVNIDPGTDLSQSYAAFEIGTGDALAGDAGLPYIMASCWCSVDPNGFGPNPIL